MNNMNKAKKLIEMIGKGDVLRLKWIPTVKRWGVDRIDDWPILSQLTKEAGVPTNYLTDSDYDKVLQVAGKYDITLETVGGPDED